MTRKSVALCLLLTVTSLISDVLAQDPRPSPEEASAALMSGDQLFSVGKLTEATKQYRLALKINSNLESAQAGLARTLLITQETDEALTVALAGMAAHPDSPRLLVILGDIQFRRAEMEQAEKAYQTALQVNPKEAKAYFGLARLYQAYALEAHSYAALKRAHDLDPKDPDIQLMWLDTLPRKERLAGLREYLATPHPEVQGRRQAVEESVRYLEKTADQPPHSCKMVGAASAKELKLEYVHDDYTTTTFWDPVSGGHGTTSSATPIIGAGLSAKLNGKEQLLLLDSGATGILISRKMADRAKLQRISDIKFSGIGDKGERAGYLALADDISIGGMEFRDCVVMVSEQRILKDAPTIEGLIGADIFSSFLVDINFPQKLLRLSPLPSRPGEAEPPIVLNTAGISFGAIETDTFPAPKDRFVAPEMGNWTRFLRFDHVVLVPTRVNGSKPMLFVVDSGSYMNVLSARAAKSAAKMTADAHAGVDGMTVSGASGRVKDVYRTEKVDLEFGRFHQPGLNTITIDLMDESRDTGTEVSGMLGYAELLYLLDVRIDYRDGLVDFAYRDPHGVTH